jgi:hypothetical protein
VLEASLAESDDGGRLLAVDSGAVVTRVEEGISLAESGSFDRLLTLLIRGSSVVTPPEDW